MGRRERTHRTREKSDDELLLRVAHHHIVVEREK